MFKTTTTFAAIFAVITTCFIAQPASAQNNYDEVEIKTTKLTDSVYMLEGAGGNIGLSIGEDGAFLIDDQYAELNEKILAAIARITDKKVKFLINTHWHSDHTGGNEILGKSGTIIVAHDNVRTRMSEDQLIEAFGRQVPASPGVALPIITFADAVRLHFNGDEINVQHVEPAHTDGDSIVHFKKANVLHMGDTFFNGMYPFIDVSSGGSIDGMIAAADTALKICDDKTKIIPGHGKLANQADLREYREVLQTVRDSVRLLVDAGKTRDEVIAAKPTAKFDADWGQGFMEPDVWVGIVYDGMVKGE